MLPKGTGDLVGQSGNEERIAPVDYIILVVKLPLYRLEWSTRIYVYVTMK